MRSPVTGAIADWASSIPEVVAPRAGRHRSRTKGPWARRPGCRRRAEPVAPALVTRPPPTGWTGDTVARTFRSEKAVGLWPAPTDRPNVKVAPQNRPGSRLASRSWTQRRSSRGGGTMMTRTSQETSRVLSAPSSASGWPSDSPWPYWPTTSFSGSSPERRSSRSPAPRSDCGPGDDRRQPARCLRGRRRGPLITGARDVATAGVPRNSPHSEDQLDQERGGGRPAPSGQRRTAPVEHGCRQRPSGPALWALGVRLG